MNVYRYLSYGELRIINPESAVWAYSSTHLDEIYRNGNRDALSGMKMLEAREVKDNLDSKFKSVGNITLNGYIDPTERYNQHLEAINGFDGADDLIEKATESLPELIDRLTEPLNGNQKSLLQCHVKEASKEMKDFFHEHFSEVRPIEKTRNSMGLKSHLRKKIERTGNPIEEIWKIIEPNMDGVPLGQFFGFDPHPATIQSGLPHTQDSSLGSAHIILNMLGFSPDSGLNKRDKIRNIMADGRHVGMASYCNHLLSADMRFINKARAIYSHAKIKTEVCFFQYNKEGTSIKILAK